MKRKFKKYFLKNWLLIGILILAAFLYGWKTWDAGEANSFYTAAITSMTQSFHNFWFASFDPAGYITVDKPPVALWFMAISTKIFGLHGWSIVLPSVLFGIGSVALIYIMVKRHFGKRPGYLAALAMTFTPIVVADSRTNNMDATLVFFLLLSFYTLDKAIQKHNDWLTVLSFALIGVSFNVKMLQAFMVLPAMIVFYYLASHRRILPKLRTLSISVIALLVFTLIWPLSVDMTPANQRPYEGGSQHNSVMELAFGYNGAQRLLGQNSGGGNQPSKTRHRPSNHGHKAKPHNTKSQKMKPSGMKHPMHHPAKPHGHAGGPGQGNNNSTSVAKNGGGGPFDIGNAGPLRLFQSQLGPQVSWLLIFAILGLISSLIYYHSDRKKWYQLTSQQKDLILWVGWLVPVAGFFSIASFFHPYYMIMLAPPIAVLFGIGVKTMYQQMKDTSFHNYKFYFLPLAILATFGLEAWYTSASYIWFSILLIILSLSLTIALIILTNRKLKSAKRILTTALAILILAPAWWAVTPTITGSSAGIPTAGPALLSSHNNQAPGGSLNRKMLHYLEKHDGNAKFLFTTDDSNTASPYIIKTHHAVMSMGGFTGDDPSMKLKRFKRMVKNGEVKYYLGGGQDQGNQTVVNWIKRHGHKISPLDYGGSLSTSHGGPNQSNQLYRLDS